MKYYFFAISTILYPLIASAINEPQDSAKTYQLDDIVVESKLQSTSATVSTFIPTSKQKNSSQSGTELLNRMAIPQLALGMGNSVKTVSGKAVDIFIDYLPATEQDLTYPSEIGRLSHIVFGCELCKQKRYV